MTTRLSLADCPGGWRTDASYVYIGQSGKGLPDPNIFCRLRLPQRAGEERIDYLSRYENLVESLVMADEDFRQGIARLHNCILVCNCPASHPCHGDVLAWIADAVYSKLQLGYALSALPSWEEYRRTIWKAHQQHYRQEEEVRLQIVNFNDEMEMFPPDPDDRTRMVGYFSGLRRITGIPAGEQVSAARHRKY